MTETAPTVIRLKRTLAQDSPPESLDVGEPGVELAHPGSPRVWIGVPAEIHPSGRRRIGGLGAWTYTVAEFAAPEVGGAVAVAVDDTTFIPVGLVVWIAGMVFTVTDAGPETLTLLRED